MEIRDATPDDIAGILAIYNDAVAHTTAIWNETPVDAANRRAWMAERQAAGYPVLVAVAVDGGEVIGIHRVTQSERVRQEGGRQEDRVADRGDEGDHRRRGATVLARRGRHPYHPFERS